MGGGARETRVADNQRRVVLFLGFEKMQQRHRVRFRRVTTDQEDRFRVVDIVVRIGHRTVAPGVGYAGNRGRMADPGLVINVIGAPVGGKLAEEVRALVGELRATQPVNRVRTAFLADLQHLVADLVDRFVPGDFLPLSADHFHRVLETAFAVGMLAHGGAFGAMCAKVEGTVPTWLLPDPGAILDFRHHRAANRAVSTHGLFANHFPASRRRGCGLNAARRQ